MEHVTDKEYYHMLLTTCIYIVFAQGRVVKSFRNYNDAIKLAKSIGGYVVESELE